MRLRIIWVTRYPYVDNTYFKSLKKLEETAKRNNANLTLLGISPTYPSEKYGYK